jgi:hypothetical protein
MEAGGPTPEEFGGPTAGGAEGAPSQEEMQRQIEEQLRKVRVQDLLLESVVGILNLTMRRIAKEDERDLDQARVGIESVRAVLELLDPEPREQVREALSQVQVRFAQQAKDGGEAPEGAGEGGPERPPAAEPERPQSQRPGGLWTPPGT